MPDSSARSRLLAARAQLLSHARELEHQAAQLRSLGQLLDELLFLPDDPSEAPTTPQLPKP